MYSDFSMIILAGGKSSRMGTDKADLLFKGKSFLRHQIDKGSALGIEDILVSGYRGENCSVPVIRDNVPEKGPLGGLEACFRKAKHPKCLVLSVDVPLVPVEELQKLLEYSRRSAAPAVILRHGAKQEPLIGVYASDLADRALYEISRCKGSMFAFIEKIGFETVESCAAETAFANINDRNSYNCII